MTDPLSLDLPADPLPDRFSLTRSLPPNRRTEWVTLDGPGCIRHIWVTLRHPRSASIINRKMIIRITFDGADTPHVEAPIGDFFGLMHGADFYPIDTHWLSAKEYSGYNCYFPMPFAQSARIELETSDEPDHCYMQVDWHRYPGASMPEPRRFCCRWRKENPTQRYGEDYLMLDADGPGQLLGFVYGVRLLDDEDRWSHGGGDNIYVDGLTDRPAYLRGIGGEDTFGASYGGAHHPPETHHYAAMPYYEHEDVGRPRRAQRIVGYRFFEHDALPFRKSVHVRFGCMANNICSTAYWYQEGGPRDFVKTPPFEALLPDAPLPRGEMDLPLPDAGEWLVRCPIDNADDTAVRRALAGDPQPDDPAGAPWRLRPSLRGFVDFNHVSRPHETGVGRHYVYAAGEARAVFDSPAAGEGALTLSWDDRMVIRVNDAPPIDLGEHCFFRTRSLPVELKAGRNELRVTLSNTTGSNHGGWAFACSLRTADSALLKPAPPTVPG